MFISTVMEVYVITLTLSHPCFYQASCYEKQNASAPPAPKSSLIKEHMRRRNNNIDSKYIRRSFCFGEFIYILVSLFYCTDDIKLHYTGNAYKLNYSLVYSNKYCLWALCISAPISMASTACPMTNHVIIMSCLFAIFFLKQFFI